MIEKGSIRPLFLLLQIEIFIYYFFLCEEQNFDLPLAVFLQLFPSLVFAAHFAMFPPFLVSGFIMQC